jgi:bifunctional UDP-N-acetylglucosamine pyrophosphorylase/glucosamine-1-phosphate N-acetyltransferase
MQAESLLRGQADVVLVTYADMPLITAEILRQLVQAHQAQPGPITMLTVLADDPRGFGRIVRDAAGGVRAIAEEAQATLEQLAIRERAGVYSPGRVAVGGAAARAALAQGRVLPDRPGGDGGSRTVGSQAIIAETSRC